ncbi:hypothetical protein [Pelagicoccus sp. SDUM812005]|uniref:hypothetical protein n=1 Tax=Pelagicoccus sp. SDUM812005 TaxID=3041257 RepID=UPI00280CF986|nr:hypothetical protein [Pelagicoccus sp. SDUM812005]MDQ8182088.1 hypothetical protein [Pelagicoccus sp. SDUM812005]
MPPPPEEQAIGSEGEQIDPNGELASQSEGGEAGESGEQQASRKGRQNSGGQQDEATEGDGQAMPENIGGSSGSKRGKGTIDDVAVPSNL